MLRWAVYEAGKAHARTSAPDHAYYAQVKDRKNTKRAALSEARKIIRQACHILAELGDDAFAAAVTGPVTAAAARQTPQARTTADAHKMGNHRGQLPPTRCQPPPARKGRADGLIRLSGRIPRRRGAPNPSSCRRGASERPADPGKAG